MEKTSGSSSLALASFWLLVFVTIATNGASSERHIFDDLTESELQEAIDYLYRQPDLGLVRGEKQGLRSSFLRMVEAMDPIKQQALSYIDDGGPIPMKRATAILYRGDLPTPVVQEIVIWPIPSPRQHTLYKNSKWRDPIPFTARSPLNDVQQPLIQKKMEQEIAIVDHIIFEASGYRFTNCTQFCLDWAPGGPPHASPGGHKMLGFLIRRLEGKYIHPIGLQFVLNMEPMDVDQWHVSFVSFQGKEFESFSAMKKAYECGEFGIRKTPIPENHDNENLPSSLNFRGTPRPAANQRGRRTFVPDGDRMSITGRQVDWLGWSFNFNVRSSTGIQLHDIRFLNERIVYELSLQELVVQYSGGDAHASHTLFFDSDAMLGVTGSELFPGVDCPPDARYFDTVHFLKGKPVVFKRSICVFEWDRGIPLRRHAASNYNGGFVYFQGMPDIVLVVRTVPTIDNYDYVLDIMFHQDGKIEVKTSLTGYLVATYYQGEQQDKYGYVVNDNAMGNIHVHLVNFKVDMDIIGKANRFNTLNLKLENITDNLNPGKYMLNRYFEADLKETEKAAAYKYNFETPKYLVFSTEQSKNKFGTARGYRIVLSDIGKFLLPENHRLFRSLPWAYYQVAVTKYNEDEKRSSSLYNYMEPFDPVFSLQDYIDDDENIVDEDLVSWVTLTAHHIPHTEDVPIVTTNGVQLTFYLLPYNFFNEDPSLASRDNIRVTPTASGGYTYRYSGVQGEEHCHHDDIECLGVVEPVSKGHSLMPSLIIIQILLALFYFS